jgi:hypothetical protein
MSRSLTPFIVPIFRRIPLNHCSCCALACRIRAINDDFAFERFDRLSKSVSAGYRVVTRQISRLASGASLLARAGAPYLPTIWTGTEANILDITWSTVAIVVTSPTIGFLGVWVGSRSTSKTTLAATRQQIDATAKQFMADEDIALRRDRASREHELFVRKTQYAIENARSMQGALQIDLLRTIKDSSELAFQSNEASSIDLDQISEKELEERISAIQIVNMLSSRLNNKAVTRKRSAYRDSETERLGTAQARPRDMAALQKNKDKLLERFKIYFPRSAT